MSIANVKNFAVGVVSTGYNAAAVSITMNSGESAKMPPVPFYAVWWDADTYASPDLDPNKEIIYVTDLVTETYTISRAQDNTAAATHNTAGKTYKLMATVTAKELGARSVTLAASVGPTADVTTGISDWGTLMTVPANFLAVGDVLEFEAMYHHKSGAYSYNPRVGLQFAGFDLIPLASHWAAFEFTLFVHAKVMMQTLGGSGICFRTGQIYRENGAFLGATYDGRMTFNTTVAKTLVGNYRFDSAGETINLGAWSVKLHRQ